MHLLLAADYGIAPEQDITKALAALLRTASTLDGAKTIQFEHGIYYLNSTLCEKHRLVITNTARDAEFSEGETPHLQTVPFYFGDIQDLILDGADSVFVLRGKATNMALEHCKNVTLRNLEIRHAQPDLHELCVLHKTPFFADFSIDRDTSFTVRNGMLYFSGQDYEYAAIPRGFNADWIGRIRKSAPNCIKRVGHPLFGAFRVREIGERKIRAYFPCTWQLKKGDLFSLFDTRRQFVGIFVNDSENITLQNIRQRFNYSLALVAQDCRNLTADKLDFSPEQGSARRLTSIADFIQICMCRGEVSVTNSNFDCSGDDCLNVHGIHFRITEKQGNQITVRFMHAQTHGFNPLHTGDTVAFISPKTMLESGRAVIQDSCLLNEYEIALTLDDISHAIVGNVIEDVDACPDVYFANNTLNRIITRGLLLTTRGKVRIENNRFISTSMSGILLSDDAKSWYESGMCCDVTIRNNIFSHCGQAPIRILPENAEHAGAVHKNIQILDNDFDGYTGYCITAKSTDGLLVRGNRFASAQHLRTKNCTHVREE